MDTLQDWMLANGNDAQALVFFGALALLVILERWMPKRDMSGASVGRLLSNGLMTALNVGLILVLPISFVAAAHWAQQNDFGLLNSMETTSAALLIGGTLLARAFISFFTHYLNHKIPLLWRFHRVHHLDTELDVSTTVRFHPGETLINPFIGLPFVFGVGMVPWVLILYELLDAGVTVFSHANLRVPAWINSWLRFLIVTPDLHRVHHSSYQPETDSNYGAVFPIWDQIFGTFRLQAQEPQETMELGLSDLRGSQANNPLRLLVSPLFRDP